MQGLELAGSGRVAQRERRLDDVDVDDAIHSELCDDHRLPRRIPQRDDRRPDCPDQGIVGRDDLGLIEPSPRRIEPGLSAKLIDVAVRLQRFQKRHAARFRHGQRRRDGSQRRRRPVAGEHLEDLDDALRALDLEERGRQPRGLRDCSPAGTRGPGDRAAHPFVWPGSREPPPRFRAGPRTPSCRAHHPPAALVPDLHGS